MGGDMSNDDNDVIPNTENEPIEDENRDSRGRFKVGNTEGFSTRPQDINRNGRPPRPSLTAALIRRLEEEGDGTRKSGRRIAEDLIEATIELASQGSFKHLRELWIRIDGRGDLLPDMMRGKTLDSTEDHKEAAIKLYRAVVEDPKSSTKDKLKAQSYLNELLGLTEPSATPAEAARAIQQAALAMMSVSYTKEDDDEDETEEIDEEDDEIETEDGDLDEDGE